MANKYFTSFDGAKIFYTVTEKSDKWLIFLHGLGGDETAWNDEKAYFTKSGYSTVAVDLRGHGLSARSDKPGFYSMENFASDINCLIKNLNIRKACIIGHCFGGMVAMIFAAKYRNLLKSLILVDTGVKAPFVSDREIDRLLIKGLLNLLAKNLPDFHIRGHADFKSFIGSGDFDLRRLKSDILHTSLRSYLSISADLIKFKGEVLLSKINVPTLVIEGEEDKIFPPETARFIASRIRKNELNLIPEANHIIVINNPRELNSTIQTFLKKTGF